jgi:hypothetical protein
VAEAPLIAATPYRKVPTGGSAAVIPTQQTFSPRAGRRLQGVSDCIRSRAEGDKSMGRSERWPRLASAVKWLACEAIPLSLRWRTYSGSTYPFTDRG